MTYTKFERDFLVGAYLVVERTGREIVDASDVLNAFNLEPRTNWIRRAIQSYTDNGYSRGRMHMGDEREQHIYLSPEGVKEAERLIDEGIVIVADLEGDSTEDRRHIHGVIITDEADGQIVPASDRIVRLDHNSDAYGKAVTEINALSEAIRSNNNFGNMTKEAVSVATAEVDSLKRELEGEAVRASAFWDRAKSLLGWIAREAGGALVGAVALGALAAIGSLLGFQAPF